jgi:hypothetical protein
VTWYWLFIGGGVLVCLVLVFPPSFWVEIATWKKDWKSTMPDSPKPARGDASTTAHTKAEEGH